MELNLDRMYRPWTHASPPEKAFVVLGLAGVCFALYGDIVYWFEHGNGYFDAGFPWGGANAVSQPLFTLDSLSAVVGGVLALQTVRASWRLRFFALGYFAFVGGLMTYSASRSPHPVSIVPAAVLLAATIAGAIAFLKGSEERPAEVE